MDPSTRLARLHDVKYSLMKCWRVSSMVGETGISDWEMKARILALASVNSGVRSLYVSSVLGVSVSVSVSVSVDFDSVVEESIEDVCGTAFGRE